MALMARILGWSLLTSALGAALGGILFASYRDSSFAALLLGCVGGIIGAIAAGAKEIATALRRKPSK